jgi:hypothetical protein
MLTPWSAIRDRLMRYASTLRFPKLLAITAALFVIDLIFPDVVPFVDEILLGLISLLFASLRNKPKALPDNERTGKS